MDNVISNNVQSGMLYILYCCSFNKEIKAFITEQNWHLNLYNFVKDEPSHNTIIKKDIIEKKLLENMINILKQLTIGQQKVEQQLAQLIKDDLKLLETKKDSLFIKQVIEPLLSVESCVPICLHPFDSEQKKWLTPKQQPIIETQKPKTTQQPPLQKSQLLSQNEKWKLNEYIKAQVSDQTLRNKLLNSQWNLIYSVDSQPDASLWQNFWKQVENKGPFICLIQGQSNSGKKEQFVYGCLSCCSAPSFPQHMEEEYSVNIETHDSNFSFFFDEQRQIKLAHTKEAYDAPFASFNNESEYEGGGFVSLHHEYFFLSFGYETGTYFEPQTFIHADSEQSFTPPNQLNVLRIEWWVCDFKQKVEQQSRSAGFPVVTTHQWITPVLPLQCYRSLPVFYVPVGISAKKLASWLIGQSVPFKIRPTGQKVQGNQKISEVMQLAQLTMLNNIFDLEFETQQLQQLSESQVPGYLPQLGVLNSFVEQEGMQQLFQVVFKVVEQWKDKQLAQRWQLWMEELSSFSNIPGFFTMFFKNNNCKQLVFQLLGTDPPQSGTEEWKVWEQQEQEAVKFLYSIIQDVFKVQDDPELRYLACKHGLLTKILERLGILAKEKPRKYVEDVQEEEKIEQGNQGQTSKIEIDKSKPRKGVGYASDNLGQNQRWDVDTYFKSKKQKNEQISTLVTILTNFISSPQWIADEEMINQFCCSPLLPILEINLGSGSLLDMGKEQELYMSLLGFIKAVASKPSLFVLLEDLDSHYEPKQKASVATLLSGANDLANIFMQCLGDQKQNSEQQQLEQLAKEIQSTFKQVQQALLEDPQEQLETDFQEILKLPLSEKYRFLLQDLRFDYMDMKKQGGGFKHHYDNMAQRNGAPPQAKMIRLAQELADLSGALPCEYTNSIFIRVDKEKVDLMKAVVMGSSGTPYAHGAFEYDIFFEDNYPNGPPKVNLETTGGGQTRFNPNLYNCGKVCLSLLGTWRGNASENWDPKLSTLLQVLMSLQSIIMSDEVYFNEPGFEGEAGTEEGEAKNEGYSNIVRYSNIRFSMIDQMRNPSKGFETVIKRHFYLKQFEILKEVNEWLEIAKSRKASYGGLVSDHNHNWASQFKGGKEIYVKFLKEAIKELEDEFAKLEAPSGKDIIRYTKKVKKQKKKVKKQIKEGENLEDIDVGSDTEEVKVSRELNVESEEVKDRWSRYIGAMGVEAVAKQSKANILISGLGGVGIEIAKNIVLAGCKRLVLHDTKLVRMKDVSSQFFLRVDQIGQNRALASLQRIQQLNYYVKVEATTEGLEQMGFEQFQCIILTDCDSKDIETLDGLCYKNNIPLIAVDGYGVFGRIYTNFGQKFEVLDKDGEELQEFVIESISKEEKCVITLLKGSKHNLQEGDMCLLAQLQGMGQLNDSLQKCVEVINTHTFRIEFDSRVLGEYQGNGIMKQVKQKIEKKFIPFKEAMSQKMYDGNLYISDFEKIQNWDMSHVAFQALEKMIPEPWNLKQANEFVEICKEIAQQQSIQAEKQHEKFWKQFAFTCRDGSYNPLCATLGGIAAQEIVKSITQKYIPIYQLFYLDFIEVLPEVEEGQEEGIRTHLQKCESNRDYGLQVCLGQTTCENLRKVKLFMVGCGAIGCELLKNYAMLNIGSEGQIVITDPDVIEVSNLNRQFLFREKHLRKPKSSTAAAAAIAMNGSLKNHIIARIDKVHEGTKEIFTEKFFEELSVVTNALDNVQARRYVDSRCVSAKISLIDSGTLGPKGHVQVIIPNKTESYGSQQDPVEENEIPVCTLKMFPEETLHCVEWARDLFGKWFTTHPKVLSKVVEEKIPPTSQQDLQNLRIAIKKLKKRPLDFNDCIQYARKKYQKLFVNDIRQLMTVYPLDAKTKEGAPFWSLPKRPPKELAFISENEYCSSFIWAYASLYAKVYGLKLPEQIRNPQEKLNIGQAALQYVQPEFIPNEEKAKQIQGEVEKQKEQAKEEEEESMSQQDASSLMNELETLLKQQALQMIPEEFEKDLDTNFHIDFIHAAANCRALNYSLQPMEWIQVKLKAGRIIPALATTTAAIAGLQTAELVKIIKGCDVGKFRNSFLNLSVPSLQCSEPGAPEKIKLNEEVVVTVWDRWEVSLGKEITLKQLLDHLEQTYKLFSRDVLYGSKPIFLKALVQNSEKQLNQKVIDLCETEEDYVDLTVTFASSQEGEILSGTPIVRVQFKQKKD